jgi:acyl-CoA thioesterase-1
VTASFRITCLAAAVAVGLASNGLALADPPAIISTTGCATPPGLSAIEVALDRSASRIQAGKPLTIVAIGSSSTQGVGASAPALSYPSRLEQELRDRLPAIEVRVINHGIGGQDVGEELARIDRDVLAEHPDLVIWQVGTNAVLRRDDLSVDERLIWDGVAVMRAHGIDVVLMDLQYAPRVLDRPATAQMEQLIAELASRTQVGLFRRYEMMREWDRTNQLAPSAMIGPDGLHMTDASYGCLASQLAEALAWNWRSPTKLAKSPQRNPDAVAGVQHPAREYSASIR